MRGRFVKNGKWFDLVFPFSFCIFFLFCLGEVQLSGSGGGFFFLFFQRGQVGVLCLGCRQGRRHPHSVPAWQLPLPQPPQTRESVPTSAPSLFPCLVTSSVPPLKLPKLGMADLAQRDATGGTSTGFLACTTQFHYVALGQEGRSSLTE